MHSKNARRTSKTTNYNRKTMKTPEFTSTTINRTTTSIIDRTYNDASDSHRGGNGLARGRGGLHRGRGRGSRGRGGSNNGQLNGRVNKHNAFKKFKNKSLAEEPMKPSIKPSIKPPIEKPPQITSTCCNKFNKSKWNFDNEIVDLYRIQSNKLDHTLMLPHPISQSFPEFFSSNTIPKKKQFIAQVLPPLNNQIFPTTSKQWKVRVSVQETTAKQLINKAVEKLKTSLESTFDHNSFDVIKKSNEFIIKIVGCEEYILYDDTKLIVDYEAVRKAVRNEDDVIFQLSHRPDLSIIEQECFDKNIWHISKYKDKYFNSGLLTDKIIAKVNKNESLKYCPNSFGDGKSLNEIRIAKKHSGFTKPWQLQLHTQMKSNRNKTNQIIIVPNDDDFKSPIELNVNNSNDIPPPPPATLSLHTLSASNGAFSFAKKHKSISLMEDETEYLLNGVTSDDDNDIPPPPPPVTNMSTSASLSPKNNTTDIPPPPPPKPTANPILKSISASATTTTSSKSIVTTPHKHQSNVSGSFTRTIKVTDVSAKGTITPPQRSIKRAKTPNVRIRSKLADDVDLQRSRSKSVDKPQTKLINKNTSKHKATDKQQINAFAKSMKILSGKEILSNIPSLADTQHLYDIIPRKADQIKKKEMIREMLLHEFGQFYRIKINFITNVTHLPRYKLYLQQNNGKKSKKLCVICRHELWIGDLKYNESSFDTDYKIAISDGMRFNNLNYFQSKKQRYCDLARETCISFTIYLCKVIRSQYYKDIDNNNKDIDDQIDFNNNKPSSLTSQISINDNNTDSSKFYEFEMPIAFVRLPIISCKNLLRDGKYALNLWPIPIYLPEYKGAKCDPYGNLSFRYRGPTIDRHLKRFKRKKSIVSASGNGNGNDDDVKPIAKLQNIFKLGIEFEARKFRIVAPPLNYRWNYKSNNSSKSLKQQARELSRKQTAMLGLNTPDDNPSMRKTSGSFMGKLFSKKDKVQKAIDKNNLEAQKLKNKKQNEWKRVHQIVSRDILYKYTESDKKLIWEYREDLSKLPNSINCFLKCVDWRDPLKRSEAYDYIEKWTPSPHLEDSLELLSYEYMDTFVREYAIMRISEMHDSDLQTYLLQFVQCLKYELYHNNSLIRLLMRRGLSNPLQIGHFLFWHIKSEYLDKLELNLMYIERFGLYLEEYLLYSQSNVARDILIQCNLCLALSMVNSKLRLKKKLDKTPKDELKKILKKKLTKLNSILPNTFILPINPRWRCTSFVVDECKTMDSAQLPLWLSCKNVDESVGDANVKILFKTGDDLRQDILTLQILRVMDKVWLDRGLNLRLLPYNVVSTGDGQGMVEIVLNSTTTTHIHTHYGGGAQKGARDITTHYKYIYDVNNNNFTAVRKARDIYTRSTAGYCIASYVLGLGDRHPSNIMVRKSGELFHIDFSHFLGNFKSQKIIGELLKWQRETAPFVFLPAYKYCIENGNNSSKNHDKNGYNNFIQFSVNAYLALRQRHRLLINLFILMLPSQMPELIIKQHIDYLKNQLHLNDIKNENVYQHIYDIIKQCLSDKRRIMDNMFHAMKHS